LPRKKETEKCEKRKTRKERKQEENHEESGYDVVSFSALVLLVPTACSSCAAVDVHRGWWGVGKREEAVFFWRI
jgi:hypothetical protein